MFPYEVVFDVLNVYVNPYPIHGLYAQLNPIAHKTLKDLILRRAKK